MAAVLTLPTITGPERGYRIPIPPCAVMGLVVLHLHLHGLFRGHAPEAGRDADCGGQTIYVNDLARSLATRPELQRVEVLTRLIHDSAVDPLYGQPLECVSSRYRIRRLAFGPPGYLAKEALWPHLDQLVGRLERRLRAAPRPPDWIHAHYADAGYVGARLQQRLGIPLAFTGHSLGREKRRRLLQAGHDPAAIERRYQLARRIAAEELALAHSSLVVTSTHQELSDQYGRYLSFRPERAQVIAPGVDPHRFHPSPGGGCEREIAALLASQLHHPLRPPLLALCRPDPRKNIGSLLEAFARSPRLHQHHNLVLALGSALDGASCAPGTRAIDSTPEPLLEPLQSAIRRHRLQGRVALLRQLPRRAIPSLYRWAAGLNGLFVNPALTEPFGLTLLEAAACGLPVVATDDGGPREIVARCRNGLLVDVGLPGALGRALEEAAADPLRWRRWSEEGVAAVRLHYSWPGHTDRYLRAIAAAASLPAGSAPDRPRQPLQRGAQGWLTPLPAAECWALESGIQ